MRHRRDVLHAAEDGVDQARHGLVALPVVTEAPVEIGNAAMLSIEVLVLCRWMLKFNVST